MTILIEQWISDFNAQLAGDEFPDWQDPCWHTFSGPLEEGKQEAKAEVAGKMVAQIHSDLASREFIDAVGKHLGYDPGELLPDPDRIGGGIHQCAPGGRLGLHVDFSIHPTDPSLLRAVNVIVFLSQWGLGAGDNGALVMRVCDQEIRISPSPGLLVAWRAEDDIFHGHPEPFPEDAPRRRSIAVYYYRRITDDERALHPARNTTFLEG